MRRRTAWRDKLRRALGPVWDEDKTGMAVGRFLDAELGIFLHLELAPNESVEFTYELLAGYPLLEAVGSAPTTQASRHLAIARHLIAPLRTRRDWTAAVKAYREVPEDLRGFELDPSDRASARVPSIAPDRFDIYASALETAPPLARRTSPHAGPGSYTVALSGGQMTSVTIPEEVIHTEANGHDVSARSDRGPVTFTWDELERTAAELDQRETAIEMPVADRGQWLRRFEALRLRCRNGDEFVAADHLEISGVKHLIGMVGAGKSTLMLLMAACAAWRGQQVTIVVGDVLAALRHVTWFTTVGVAAAPVVGASTQERHINRLHQVHATKPHRGSALLDLEPSHDLLSSACSLNALRTDSAPWRFGDAPCRDRLTPVRSSQTAGTSGTRFGCPLWGQCQRHETSRTLVDAQVWIATTASLVHSRVPQELNADQLRYLELAWRRSDLLIVDEADQVQTQLDAMFSPSQTLIGHDNEAWLEILSDHTERELRGKGRAQFVGGRPVREWTSRLDTARALANRLYALLTRHPLPRGSSTMLRWIGRDCFTEWTLTDKLVRQWADTAGPVGPSNSVEDALRSGFGMFLEDPLGIRNRTEGNAVAESLVALTHGLMGLVDEDECARFVHRWLEQLPTVVPGLRPLVGAEESTREQELRIEFTVLLAVLSNTLNSLIRGWRAVEGPLALDSASGTLFQRPPEDYSALVPTPPMGSILGYQYREAAADATQMGQLRFFRCSGIGRWLLLHLDTLFAADSPTGPAVLAMSGTSWAGTSPRYDLQLPVTAILQASDEQLAKVARSEFFLATVNDSNGQPIAVSGRKGEHRQQALRSIVRALASRPRLDRPSPLEVELDVLPDDRRRILLLVGSYREARQVAEDLVEIRTDWRGKVLHLISDDTDFTSTWSQAIRRGDVHRLGTTEATILVAPLLAIERGHNILNEEGRAAVGAAYFLVRPHPHPDDITYPVQSMSRWAVERIHRMAQGDGAPPESTVHEVARQLRQEGYRRWQRLLTAPLVYGNLDERTDQRALAWTQLVTIWQVIGRLVRGGSAARVHFCDAKFKPDPMEPSGSLLIGMYNALREYLDPETSASPGEVELATSLYGPLHRALKTLVGTHDGQV